MSSIAKFIRASIGALALLLVWLFKAVWHLIASPPLYSKPSHQPSPNLGEPPLARWRWSVERIESLEEALQSSEQALDPPVLQGQ